MTLDDTNVIGSRPSLAWMLSFLEIIKKGSKNVEVVDLSVDM